MIQTQKDEAFHVSFESTEFSEKDSEANINETKIMLKNNNQK